MPSSVQVGSDLTTAPRYYYSSNGHGDVVVLTVAGGSTVATYSYDTFGAPTIWESITTGWHNPYLYDGRDGARYDSETGLYWLSVRAYDPTLGRFLSRDPLGRTPLFFDASQPYAYGGNNPVNNVDPSGQMFRGAFNGEAMERPAVRRATVRAVAYRGRQVTVHRVRRNAPARVCDSPGAPRTCSQIDAARNIARIMASGLQAAQARISVLGKIAAFLAFFVAAANSKDIPAQIASWWNGIKWLPSWLISGVAKLVIPIGTAMGMALSALDLEFEWLKNEFSQEAGQSDRWWSSSQNYWDFYNRIQNTLAGLILLGTTIGAIIAIAGVANPVILGLGAGLVAAGFFSLFNMLPLVTQALNQEERALNW